MAGAKQPCDHQHCPGRIGVKAGLLYCEQQTQQRSRRSEPANHDLRATVRPSQFRTAIQLHFIFTSGHRALKTLLSSRLRYPSLHRSPDHPVRISLASRHQNSAKSSQTQARSTDWFEPALHVSPASRLLLHLKLPVRNIDTAFALPSSWFFPHSSVNLTRSPRRTNPA